MNLNYLVSYYLEPVSFLLFFLALLYYGWVLNKTTLYKSLAGFYLVMFALQIWALYARPVNMHIYHLSYLITSLAFAYYFYHVLQIKVGKIVSVATGVIALLYFLVNVVILGEKLFDSAGYVISSLGITVMVFMYFYQVMKNVTEKPITSDFNFWFISSQLIYHLGAFGVFLTFNSLTKSIMTSELYVKENRIILTSLWGVHNVLLFLGCLLTWFGIIWIFYHKKSPSS